MKHSTLTRSIFIRRQSWEHSVGFCTPTKRVVFFLLKIQNLIFSFQIIFGARKFNYLKMVSEILFKINFIFFCLFFRRYSLFFVFCFCKVIIEIEIEGEKSLQIDCNIVQCKEQKLNEYILSLLAQVNLKPNNSTSISSNRDGMKKAD